MSSDPSTLRRIIVGEGVFAIEVPIGGAARVFTVSSSICRSRVCPLLHLQVHAAVPARGGTVRPDGAPLSLELDGAAGVLLAPPTAASPFSEDVTRALVEHLRTVQLESLVERWRRLRFARSPGQVPLGWSPGSLAVYTDVFSHGWDLTFDVLGRHYLALDCYCLKPSCPCTALAVRFIELGTNTPRDIVVHASLPAKRDEVTGDAIGVDLWRALLDHHSPTELRKRHKRVRTFADSDAFLFELARRFGITAPHIDPRGSVHRLLLWIGTELPVWRRVEVDSDTELASLDPILRRVLGRPEDERSTLFAVQELEGRPAFSAHLGAPIDPRAPLRALAPARGARLYSGTDDAEGWNIDVLVEAIYPRAPGAVLPRVVDGEGALPPKACETPEAFASLLDALDDPRSPKHERALELLGRDFDPEAADDEGWADVVLDVDETPSAPEDVTRVLDAMGP
ncbi:plasmid pRiA4b ORF-3 family protein [Myxococcota bacterium]|nr:plasmid pRiA4b ORF-3 family protein [Myxococcota bacterium]